MTKQTTNKFSAEVSERAVRMGFDHKAKYIGVGGAELDRDEDRLLGRDATALDSAGRADHWLQCTT